MSHGAAATQPTGFGASSVPFQPVLALFAPSVPWDGVAAMAVAGRSAAATSAVAQIRRVRGLCMRA